MKKAIFIFFALLVSFHVFAQEPLYFVNGEVRSEIRSIPPEQIEHIETLPADEETIARYGPEAVNGVMLITLCHDREATFTAAPSFSTYIASQVRWADSDPPARVIIRYIVTPEGRIVVDKELESTDGKLKRRVLKAVEEAPLWQPAMKNGSPVASKGVLHIQLPEGKSLPRPIELVIR